MEPLTISGLTGLPIDNSAVTGVATERPSYPWIAINGQRVEKFWTHPCQSCGYPIATVGVRLAVNPVNNNRLLIIDGNAVELRGNGNGTGDECDGCSSHRRISQSYPGVEYRLLDRGVERSAVQAAADHNRSLGSSIGSLSAEVLDELLAQHPGDRMTKAVMRASRFGATIEPIITNLPDDASPAGALFATGPVRWSSDSHLPLALLKTSLLCSLLDLHATGQWGIRGEIPEVLSEPARFAIGLGSPAEKNFAALTSRSGVIHSVHEASATMFDSPVEPPRETSFIVEIWTVLNGGTSSTTVIAHSR